MAGRYKPISKTLRRNPEILTLVNPTKPVRRKKRKSVVVKRAAVPAVVAKATAPRKKPVVRKAPAVRKAPKRNPKQGEMKVKRKARRRVARPMYRDPKTGRLLKKATALRRGIRPMWANKGKTAAAPAPAPAETKKRKTRKKAPKEAVAVVVTTKKRGRAPDPKSKRQRRLTAAAAREAALLPVGSKPPARPKRKPTPGAYVPGITVAGSRKHRRAPGWYVRTPKKVEPYWVYYEKNPKRRRRVSKRRSYRRNDWKAMIKPVTVGGIGFFASRVAANMTIQHSAKLPEAVRPYAGQLSSAVMLLASLFLPKKVKALQPHQNALVIGTGIAFVEQLIAKWAPASVIDRVAPPVPALTSGLQGSLDVYEAALSGMGAYVPTAGMGSYVATEEAYESQDMGAYLDTDADLGGGIFGTEADVSDYSGQLTTGLEGSRAGIFEGGMF